MISSSGKGGIFRPLNDRAEEKLMESGFVSLGIENQPDTTVLSCILVGIAFGEGVGRGVLVKKGVTVGKNVAVGRGVMVALGALERLMQPPNTLLTTKTTRIIRLKSMQVIPVLKDQFD